MQKTILRTPVPTPEQMADRLGVSANERRSVEKILRFVSEKKASPVNARMRSARDNSKAITRKARAAS
jgi:hypothetical protein